MGKYLILIFILVSLLYTGCSTGPEFERYHTKDPESYAFRPEIQDGAVVISNSKDVSVSWKDKSNHEDGYIISKALGSDTFFVVIDTLPPNTTSYTDQSKELDQNTFYRIQSYSNKYKGTDYKQVVYKLDFGNIDSIKGHAVNTRISFEWDTTAIYADMFLLEKKTEGSWEVLDSVDKSTVSYNYNDLDQAFKVDIKVTPLLLNYVKEYVKINSGTSITIDYNLPTNLDIEVTSEATAKIYWDDITPFNEEFIVLQRNGTSQFGEFDTKFIAVDTITQSGSEVFIRYSPEIFYEFTIQPYLPNKTGNTISPKRTTIVSTPPKIVELVSTSKNQATIKWEDQNYSGEGVRYATYQFTAEISVNDGPYETYSILDHSVSEITISNLKTTSTYKFRIRSYSSPYKELSFAYRSSLKNEHEFTIDQNYPEDLIASPDGNFFLSTTGHAHGNNGIIFYSSSDGSIIKEFSFDDFWSFALSPNSEFLALNSLEKLSIYSIDGNSAVLLNKFEIYANYILSFKSNDTLIIYDEPVMKYVDINTGGTEEIDIYYDHTIEETFISENKENLFWTYGNLINKYIFSSGTIEQFEFKNPTITDINSENELLVRTSNSFLLINSQGEVINEFKKPDIADKYFDELIKAVFLDEDYIIITGTGGYIHLFNKLSGDYKSSYKFFLDSYAGSVREAAWSEETKKIMALMGNYARVLTVEEQWSLMNISE